MCVLKRGDLPGNDLLEGTRIDQSTQSMGLRKMRISPFKYTATFCCRTSPSTVYHVVPCLRSPRALEKRGTTHTSTTSWGFIEDIDSESRPVLCRKGSVSNGFSGVFPYLSLWVQGQLENFSATIDLLHAKWHERDVGSGP